MDWAIQIDNYCERIDFSFWSEPVNAVTNVAFLIAAVMAWRVVRDRDDWGVRALIVILATSASGRSCFIPLPPAGPVWRMYFRSRRLYWSTSGWRRFGCCARLSGAAFWPLRCFFPFYAVVTFIVVTLTDGLNGSEGYVPSVLIMAGYGLWLKPDKPEAGRGLLIASGLLAVSLVARMADQAVCSAVPIGSHWVWHIMNAIVMYWLIAVLDRHDRRYPID